MVRHNIYGKQLMEQHFCSVRPNPFVAHLSASSSVLSTSGRPRRARMRFFATHAHLLRSPTCLETTLYAWVRPF